MKKRIEKPIILNLVDTQAVSGGMTYEETTTKPDGTVTITKKEITISTPIGTVK